MPHKDKIPLDQAFPGYPPECLDLLDRMLDLNPKTRINVVDALNHPFMKDLHDDEDEPSFKGVIDFSFEVDPDLDLQKVTNLVLQEISFYNPYYLQLI